MRGYAFVKTSLANRHKRCASLSCDEYDLLPYLTSIWLALFENVQMKRRILRAPFGESL